MSSQLPGIFTNTAVRAAMFKAFVRVMPTKKERKARNGKREQQSPNSPVQIINHGMIDFRRSNQPT